MTKSKNTANILFLVGCQLISTIAIVLIISSLCFFAGIGISNWQFPVSFALTGILYFYLGKDRYKDIVIFFKSFSICVLVIIASIFIALSFYDISYDGQTYHMEIIALLKNGWNPTTTLLPEKNYLYLYINHYPRAVELPESTIYSLVNRIEAGKATNLMLLVATVCLSLSYLLSLNKLSTIKSIILSLIITLNPVTVNQLLTTYVDGQMATLILCFFIMSLWVIKNPSATNLTLLGAIIVITANIKFTSLIYIIIFTLGLLFWVFLRKRAIFKRTFFATLLSGVIAIGIVGYHPYVINTIKFQHVFYPLMGKEKKDIITVNIPKELQEKNAAGRFFTSLFAHTDNLMNDNERKVELKIPFTFNKIDIMNASKYDSRVAGFGPLFSGIILLSVSLLILLLIKPNNLRAAKNSLYILLVISFSIVIMPDSWWARYVPQLWYIPAVILLTAELYEVRKQKSFKLLVSAMYVAFIVNISFTFIGFVYNFMMTSLIDYQLEKLKASKKPVEVQWDICSTNNVRFQENNIPYIEKNLSDKENVELIVRSNSIFIADSTVNIPKSKFILWAEQYQKPTEK